MLPVSGIYPELYRGVMHSGGDMRENAGMRIPFSRQIRRLFSGDHARVAPDSDGRWQLILRWGRDHFDNQQEAVAAGMRYVRAKGLRRLVIERDDGSLQEEIYFW